MGSSRRDTRNILPWSPFVPSSWSAGWERCLSMGLAWLRLFSSSTATSCLLPVRLYIKYVDTVRAIITRVVVSGNIFMSTITMITAVTSFLSIIIPVVMLERLSRSHVTTICLWRVMLMCRLFVCPGCVLPSV